MAVSPKDRLQTLMTTEPGTSDWQKVTLEVEMVFDRLDSEDQVAAVKRLASIGEAGADSLTRIDARGQAVLPALVELREALTVMGRPMDDETNRRLRQWLILCEGGDDCNPHDLFSLPETERAAVIEHLAQWLRSDLLSRLSEAAPDKAAAKQIKKALHRARSAGATAVAQVGGNFILPEREEYLDEAFLSPPDAGGVSFIYLYRTVFGRNTMFVMMVSDTNGILKFDAYEIPEAKFRKMIDSTRHDPRIILARADSGYVRRLIRQSAENGRLAGKSLPPEYLRTRRALGIPDEPDRPHPAYKHFDPEELKQETGLVARSAELAGHRIFADWTLLPGDEDSFMLKLEEARNSLLELSEAQKREQVERLFEQETTRILDQTGRLTWRERLLQCAYLLYLVPDEEAARQTAAVALAVADGQTPPLLVGLFRRTVDKMLGGETDKGPAPDRGGVIL